MHCVVSYIKLNRGPAIYCGRSVVTINSELGGCDDRSKTWSDKFIAGWVTTWELM